MAFRTLQINLISAENLTCPRTRKPVKKNAMAVIRAPHVDVLHSTKLDKDNGSCPYWDQTFQVVGIPANAPSFDVEVRCGRKAVDVVGRAAVPVGDFVNRLVPLGYLNCLSYRLRGRDGGFVSGIVNISVRVVVEDFGVCGISMGRPVAEDFGRSAGKKAVEGGRGCSSYGGVADRGAVTGIPVPCGMNMLLSITHG